MQLNPGLPKMAVEQQACLQATREQWRPSSLAAAAQVVVLLLVTGDCPSWILQCRTNVATFESYTAALRNNPGLLPVRNHSDRTGHWLFPAACWATVLRVPRPAPLRRCVACGGRRLPALPPGGTAVLLPGVASAPAAGVRATAPGASGGVHMWCRARSATLLLLTGVC